LVLKRRTFTKNPEKDPSEKHESFHHENSARESNLMEKEITNFKKKGRKAWERTMQAAKTSAAGCRRVQIRPKLVDEAKALGVES